MAEPRLPRDLTRMTPDQVEAIIAFYASRERDELDWRRERANAEARSALGQEYRHTADPDIKQRAANAQVMVDLLAEARSRQDAPGIIHPVDVARYRVR